MAHCPANSSRRGPHRALVDRIRDAGVNIAFATDNMTEDMFHAMKIGLIVHRGAYPGGGVKPTTQAVFDGVTANGAKALARDDLGAIGAGKKADLAIVDLNQPSLRPVNNLVSNIVHYGHPGIVHSVMVDGAFVMRDRRVLMIDEDALLKEAQSVTERVWKRLLERNPDLPAPADLRWIAG
jgi:5-methylthioadenosine/S-adenosylhomocysteine deaminase